MADRLERASISGGDALLREVHTLASATRNVGLMRVGHAAAETELSIATGEPGPDRLVSLLVLLRESIARLAAWEDAYPTAISEVTGHRSDVPIRPAGAA